MTPADRAYLEQTLRFLCRESRVSGSLWNKTISEFLFNEYASFGYETEVQASTFTAWELLDPPHFQYLTPVSRAPAATCLPVVWSGATNGIVTGTVRSAHAGVTSFIQTFDAYDWSVLPVVDSNNGLIACLLGGPQTWRQPLDNA